MEKKALREKFLTLLRENVGGKGASEKEIAVLNRKFDDVLKIFNDAITTQVITKVSPEVTITNLEKQLKHAFGEKSVLVTALTSEFEKLSKALTEKPDWYVAPHKSVKIEGPVESVVKGPIQVVKDDSTVIAALAAMFQSLMEGLKVLANRTVKIMPIAESYTIPQYVMLVDPANGAPVRPEEIGKTPVAGGMGTAIAASGGPTHVGARGADAFNDGQQTVTTAGTRVQLADDAECFQVTIQAHPDNAGDIVVGGASVVAASGTRRGLALFGSQWHTFKVSNLNQIWLDATSDGDKVNYFYEA